MNESYAGVPSTESQQAIAMDIAGRAHRGREIPKLPDTPLPAFYHPIQLAIAIYERYVWAPTSAEMHNGRDE